MKRQTIQREFELRFPVASWLHDRGLDPVLECGALGNCDVVGVRYANRDLVEMVAVELKIHAIGACLDQCRRHVPRVNETWAAFPIDRAQVVARRPDLDGVGVLGVRGRCVDVLVAARRFDGRNLSRWRWTYIRRRNQWRWRMQNPNMVRCDLGRSTPTPAEADRIRRLSLGRLAAMNRTAL